MNLNTNKNYYFQPSCLYVRSLQEQSQDKYVEYQLHGFSDASPTAYGAVIYLVAKTVNSKTHVAFVRSKSRVAPIKPQTVPRTVLLGNVLLVRLLNSVEEALKMC